MIVEVHILTYQEEEILPYALRNYSLFASRIVVHDSFSTDHTRQIARAYGAEVVDWDTGGKLNDKLARELKSTCWQGTKAEWVIVVDADELIHFPHGPAVTLGAYSTENVPIVKPRGFELVADVFPTTQGQIHDEVKFAAPDDYWYGKPVLIAPSRIWSLEYGAGAHDVVARTTSGRIRTMRDMPPNVPETWLLHCKHLGPVERIGRKYDVQRSRLSDLNVQMGWGNFDPGMDHAQAKRAAIEAKRLRLFA